ncbi:hypothetical protein RB594_001237 [Gaeumannomyces avenae]
MRHSIARHARPRPRQLASLSAAYARVASFSTSSPSPYGTHKNTPATQPPPRPSAPPPPRPRAGLPPRPAPPPPTAATTATARWLSTSTAAASPAAQGPQGAAAAGQNPDDARQQKPKPKPKPKPPSGEPDYYALFPETLAAGPPPEGPFELDARALHREFLQLQAGVHPDFHHHASSSLATETARSAARRRAEAASANVNAAYETLSSPLARAGYLLRRLYGLDVTGEGVGALVAPDGELLDEVMTAAQRIEEAGALEELKALREENDARVKADEAALAEAFARDDRDAAVALVVRLRYWLNVREWIDEWQLGRPVRM